MIVQLNHSVISFEWKKGKISGVKKIRTLLIPLEILRRAARLGQEGAPDPPKKNKRICGQPAGRDIETQCRHGQKDPQENSEAKGNKRDLTVPPYSRGDGLFTYSATAFLQIFSIAYLSCAERNTLCQ
jgi:hypothetical protein